MGIAIRTHTPWKFRTRPRYSLASWSHEGGGCGTGSIVSTDTIGPARSFPYRTRLPPPGPGCATGDFKISQAFRLLGQPARPLGQAQDLRQCRAVKKVRARLTPGLGVWWVGGLLALVLTSACDLNPQPEPPFDGNDSLNDPTAGPGLSGGSASGGYPASPPGSDPNSAAGGAGGAAPVVGGAGTLGMPAGAAGMGVGGEVFEGSDAGAFLPDAGDAGDAD